MFANSLIVLVPMDGGFHALTRPLVYLSPDGRRFEVPAGFMTDYASVPRPLWSIFPPYDRYAYAAVLHDWLYETGILTRAESDRLFLLAMKELGVGWRRYALYAGVRLGGWRIYRST